jgi:hypothetical protein
MMTILPKAEIYRRMERFWKDPNRSLSIHFFAELCGLSESLIRQVFQTKELPMSEHTQICVSRALERMTRGDVAMYYNRDKSRKLVYRQEPKPRLARSLSLNVEGGKIGLKASIRNKSDYSDQTFSEQMDKRRT